MEFEKTIATVDVHTAGEPLRIILNGAPLLKGTTPADKQQDLSHHDLLRKIIMTEPRGHKGMNGAVITPPCDPTADFGILFMDTAGFRCVKQEIGILSAVTALIETGTIEKKQEVIVETIEGLVSAAIQFDQKKIQYVSLNIPPSVLISTNLSMSVLDKVLSIDIFQSGQKLFALTHLDSTDISVDVNHLYSLQTIAAILFKELATAHDINLIDAIIFEDAPKHEDSHFRNVTIYADGQIDRSPCPAAISVKIAKLNADNKLQSDGAFISESIINSRLNSTVVLHKESQDIEARFKGKAFITGMQQFIVTADDPLKEGFILL